MCARSVTKASTGGKPVVIVSATPFLNPLPLMDHFVTISRHIAFRNAELTIHSERRQVMRVHESMFDEFFARRLPDEGFTLEEVYDEYFGLLHKAREPRPEMHGHVVTMSGEIIVPELRPSATTSIT